MLDVSVELSFRSPVVVRYDGQMHFQLVWSFLFLAAGFEVKCVG